MPSLRNICFTVNNPTAQLEPCTWGDKVIFVQWQSEIGENGTHHFQGYMEFKKPVSITYLHSLPGLHDAHFEARRGTRDQARAYCTPDKGTGVEDPTYIEGPWQFGQWRTQGQRTDLIELQNDLKAGYSLRYISNNHFSNFLRYYKAVERWIELNRPPTVEKKYPLDSFNIPPVDLKFAQLITGGPGFGKTRYAVAHFNNPLFVRHMDELLCLQIGEHDGIIFDELNFSHFPCGARINLLDLELPAQVHCRYRHVTIPQGLPRIFCHNRDDIFYSHTDTIEERGAINRRLRILKVDHCLFGNPPPVTTSNVPFSVALNQHANTLINLYTSYQDVVGSDNSSPDPYHFDTDTPLMDWYDE